MFCSWANIEKSKPVGLEQIISEEITRNLQANNEKRFTKVSDISFNKITEAGDYGGDAMLEMQFIQEYDNQIESEEEKYFESGSEEEEIYHGDGKDWDIFDPLNKEFAYVPPNVIKKNKKMENEEHTTRSGGKSASKLSTKIFNSLELSSYKEEFRRCKVHRDKQKRPSYKLLSIDPHSWRLIREMIRDQVLHKVVDVLSFDRQAVLLRGVEFWPKPVKPKGCLSMTVPPPWCMIKVFRMNLKLGKKAHVIACQEAEKEAANYARLKAAGVPCCLNVIAQKEHLLVTSYCGRILKDCTSCGYSSGYMYCEVTTSMRKFYEANFIHANLSERDIMWFDHKAYIINVSHCVDRSHRDAFDYLFRGCTNIVNFFKRKEVPHLGEPDGLFKYITGYSFLDKSSLSKLKESVKGSLKMKNI